MLILKHLWELDIKLDDEVATDLAWHAFSFDAVLGVRSDHGIKSNLEASAIQGFDLNWCRHEGVFKR